MLASFSNMYYFQRGEDISNHGFSPFIFVDTYHTRCFCLLWHFRKYTPVSIPYPSRALNLLVHFNYLRHARLHHRLRTPPYHALKTQPSQPIRHAFNPIPMKTAMTILIPNTLPQFSSITRQKTPTSPTTAQYAADKQTPSPQPRHHH